MNELAGTRPRLPESVSTWADPFILCAVIVLSYFYFSPLSISTLQLSVYIIAIATAVMVALEWRHAPKHAQNHSTREIFAHAATSWLGLIIGFGIVLLAWFTLAEYQGSYYVPFFQALPILLIATPVLGALAVFGAERFLGPSAHGGYQLGLLALGRRHEVDWRILRDDLLAWFVRGFFLPLNFSSLVLLIASFRGHELALLSGSWVQSEYVIITMVYAIIAAAVTPGYVFGWRLIRTHTTAVSHSSFAWTVTLACYLPFGPAFVHWFNYIPSAPSPEWLQPWAVHLQSSPILMVGVGGAIILLLLIHLWGEAQFGLRSSNLSNRGIITTGAYRFCKHPVYVSKCIAWFFIWMPFVSGANILDDVRLTVLFAFACAIYAFRALVEEKLLSTDPDYVAYALWIDEHGIFKKVGHLVPPLSYRWRFARWQRTGVLARGEV